MKPVGYASLGQNAEFLDGRPLLVTPQGGRVAVDARLLEIWRYAQERSLPDVLTHFADLPPHGVRAALACLAEGGLLPRREAAPPVRESAPARPSEGGRVSVVIVTFNSRAWLESCLASLLAQTYQPLEIIIVDNGSQDDTLPWLAARYPGLPRLTMPTPGPLAAAINAGVRHATGEYFLLLNPDVRLAPDAVAHLAAAAQAAPDAAALAPKLRFLGAPAFLNGIGNRVGRFAFGVDNALGHLDLGQFDHWRDLPSACFAAALIPRTAWEAVGALDEGFPLYYEDSEWSYRARLMGWRVLAAPQAVVYHAYGGHAEAHPAGELSAFKLERAAQGRYRFACKIPAAPWRFLWTYAADDLLRCGLALLRARWEVLRAYRAAWAQVWRQRAALRAARAALQARRQVDDRALFALQRALPAPQVWRGLPELTWDSVLYEYLPCIQAGKTRSMPEFDSSPVRLLIISHDVVDANMAGPGMRYLEMARALHDEALQVTLAVPSATSLRLQGVRLQPYRDAGALQALLAEHDVVLFSAYLLDKYPFLAESGSIRRVVDLYDPLVLENLHYYPDEALEARQVYSRQAVAQMNRLAQAGDFFLCGNERQRDFWLGVLAANGRINPYTYEQDRTLRALLDVVGIGFPARQPRREQPFLRGVHPDVPEEARIVLWGGGIWNWLDPLTLVRAWPQVVARYPEARLIFLGTRHPNPLVPVHEMARKTQALAESLGEPGRSIIFLEWVPYERREALLLEADVGVTLHPIHVETRYSARTRVLDYLWAHLPVLITEGDVTSEWVQQYGLGRVVPEADVDAVAAALLDMLSQPKAAFAAAFEPLLARFAWPRVVAPLRCYCLDGRAAPDRDVVHPAGSLADAAPSTLERLRVVWRTQGLHGVARRAWRYLQWRMRT
ncbi:MAG: hypothetical protein Fur0018_07270 [Anaerolineales bacterium]